MQGTIQIHLQKIGHLVNVQGGKCCREQHQVRGRAGWEDAKPGPTSMVVRWTWTMQRAPTRVIIEGGGLQAGANLNGGELDKEPFLRDKRGNTTMAQMQHNAQPPNRPKWRRAGARACQKCRIRIFF